MGPWQLGTAVAVAYDETGMLGVQTDGFGEAPGVHGRAQVGMYGLISRPLDANADGEGALCLFVDEGKEGFAWCGFDGRDLEKIPPASGGSSGLYNSKGSFFLQDYDTETTTFYVPIEGGAKAHLLQIGFDSSDPPKRVVDLRHADGMSITMLENSVTIKNAAGDAYIEINASGIVLNGNTKIVGGADIGGVGGQPLINLTLFETWLAALGSAIGATGATPLTGASLGALFNSAALALPAVGTTLAKGL